MSKSALENLQEVVDVLADEIGDGTLIVSRGEGRDYALVSKSYLDALERKAEAYDEMIKSPEEKEAEQADLLKQLTENS